MSDVPTWSIDIGRAAPLVFHTIDEVANWLSAEKTAWQWMQSKEINQIGANIGNLQNLWQKRLNNIENQINATRQDPNNRNAVATAIRNAFVEARMPLSTEPIAILAKRLADAGDAPGAMAALAAHSGYVRFQNDQEVKPSVLRGIVAAANLSDELKEPGKTALVGSLQAISAGFSNELALGKTELSKLLTEHGEVLATSRNRLVEYEAEIRKEWTDKIDESIKSIRATDAAFKQEMQLKASVEYWSSRAEQHRTRAKNQRCWLIGYSIVGTGALTAALIGLALIAVETAQGSNNDVAIFLKFAAVGAVLTTIGLWIGRTLLRIFLSERHLAVDAEERRTMVMTYLALTSEQKLEPADRALVLAPLFRSASDGIVKDDGPDATLAGIIARAVDIRAKAH